MRFFALLMLTTVLVQAQTPFDKLVEQFYREYYNFFPSEGTSAGFHQCDSSLEDYSPAAMDARRKMFRSYLPKFQDFAPTDDRNLMLSKIQAELLAIDDIPYWRTNPDFYSSGVTQSIFLLISRKFAPPAERLKSVIAREKLIPSLLQTGRGNLSNPPRIFTEVALEQLPGIQNFFANDVPKAFAEVTDQSLLREFQAANSAVQQALSQYQTFLKTELLPRSKGDFRIGAENYRKKLLYEENVDIPIQRLLKIGYQNLEENRREVIAVAKQIDPAKTPNQIADESAADHPTPDKLLQVFRDTFSNLIGFINSHRIITIPSPVEPILEETPPFMRALTTASMDAPGPYETKATEAYFNVTLPEQGWPRERVQQFMTAFNRGTIESTAIHESYPGHYVQLLWFRQVPNMVRKLSQANSNVEGWAHYTEQMMLDEGYGNNDPKLRFGQLIDALLRNCRYIVGLEMHTGRMTYEQGIQFFMKQAYMSRDYAERETKRGTSDPTYLVYTLGKLQILKLREDYHQKLGAAFNLQQFHTDFVRQGGIPIAIIRKTMLRNDSPSL
jgi:uncharacterized protein (DUF885 family)